MTFVTRLAVKLCAHIIEFLHKIVDTIFIQ